MTICDERILERLSEVETDTPKGMADSGDVRFSRQYIGERCRKLSNYGMPQHLGNGVYRITETGEQCLEGEIDTIELESDSDDNNLSDIP
jgi:hypothetical protein